MNHSYHQPVFLKQSIEYLNLKDDGVYVDATFGGGGHSQQILDSNSSIKLFAFDRDADAIESGKKISHTYKSRFLLIKSNFNRIRTHLALNRIKKIDGIIFDLGISSHQIDEKDRGFSFSYDAPLDMRMNREQATSASDVINNFSYEKLKQIFWEFGEEREAGRIAKMIIQKRKTSSITTTGELGEIIENATRSHKKIKAKARIFQAIRIYINGELEALRSALRDAVTILNPQGRIVVISYHSLEDRIVKKFFQYEEKDCVCPEGLLKCNCGKISTIKILTKKPIIPTAQEIKKNSRARSAKLRAALKKEIK